VRSKGRVLTITKLNHDMRLFLHSKALGQLTILHSEVVIQWVAEEIERHIGIYPLMISQFFDHMHFDLRSFTRKGLQR